MGRTRDELDRVVPELVTIQQQQADAYRDKYRYYASLLQRDDYLELFSHLDGGDSLRGELLDKALKLSIATEARDGETQAKNKLFLLLYDTDWETYQQRLAEEAEARKNEAERQARLDRLNSGVAVHPGMLDEMLANNEVSLQDEAVKQLIDYYIDNSDRQPAYQAWLEQHVRPERMPLPEQDTGRHQQNLAVFKQVTSGSGDPQRGSGGDASPVPMNGAVKVRYTGGATGFAIRDHTGQAVKVEKNQVYLISGQTWDNLKEYSPRDWVKA